ncbi:hypothetical protein [Yunchengibacter salinarum]|uniref:hypothetical protein n=1 Tax=Yunchengibacter salinarum TaxID=3133399 RepID=UPI0035B65C80
MKTTHSTQTRTRPALPSALPLMFLAAGLTSVFLLCVMLAVPSYGSDESPDATDSPGALAMKQARLALAAADQTTGHATSGAPVVVYDAKNPGSRRIATQLVAAIDAVGATTSPARMIPATDLMALNRRSLVLVPAGQAHLHDAVARAGRARELLTVSGDLSCVESGRCVIGVTDRTPATRRGGLEILVNRSACKKSRHSFRVAFRMLVRETA